MSLVEQALKKMQATRTVSGEDSRRVQTPSPSPLAAGGLGYVVEVDQPTDIASPAHRTDKLIRVNRNALRSEGLLPPEHQERVLADQYRHIKRPLISNATGRGGERLERGQLIMMASAMPGEGKTFTSINLALSMALEKDLSVLLVDADVAKPHISRTFGVEQEPGLLDILKDESSRVESVILPTDVPNLCILPAGKQSDTATELLASQRMQIVANHLEATDPNRIVLIDSPPLLLTSESRTLAQIVGQIVVVVRAGFTPQRAVLDAIDVLGENKAVGLVLNQATGVASPGYYYGYGDNGHPD